MTLIKEKMTREIRKFARGKSSSDTDAMAPKSAAKLKVLAMMKIRIRK